MLEMLGFRHITDGFLELGNMMRAGMMRAGVIGRGTGYIEGHRPCHL